MGKKGTIKLIIIDTNFSLRINVAHRLKI
jgi:hypothetical protein